MNGERQKLVAEAMGQTGENAANVLDVFIRDLGMPRTLRDVKIVESDLPRLAKNCMLDDWTYSNPRPIKGPEQVMEILRAAY